jgi:general secretion pathway protein F
MKEKQSVEEQFWYRAVSRDGSRLEGQLRAADLSDASRRLLAQGMTPLLIERSRASLDAPGQSLRRAPTRRDLQVLLEELGTLLGAGVPLAEAMPSIARSYARHPLGRMLAQADQKIRAGAALSTALQDPAITWPSFVGPLLRASEASGEISRALRQASEQMAHDLDAAQELRSALVYPTILVVAGISAVLIVFVGVIPRFAGLLKGSRAQIPDFSRWIIEFGVFLQQNLVWIGWGAAGVAATIYWVAVQPRLRVSCLQMLARVPGVGRWLRSIELGRWALVLGALLASRVPMLDAMRLAGEALRLGDMRLGMLSATRGIRQGETLSQQLEGQVWFPEARVNLIRVGERSGDLPRMLRTLGQIETQYAQTQQRRLLAIVEPVAILVIGAVIAVIMLAVMTAVTSLNAAAA